jgi:L-ascorbate metabolism protein UlaG (beta-lactamase superfamily)
MKLTWYGHAAFRIEIKNATILIDPFITGNGKCPVSVEEAARGVTHILLSHGHDDHVGDTVKIAKKTGASVIANFEVCCWAEKQGVKNIKGLNPGGEVDLGPFRIALTVAHHSSSAEGADGAPIYLGNPCGIVVMAKNEPTLYHAGDTDIFSDMALINEFYQPEIGILPIGDVYTMGAKKAAAAAKRFFDFETVLPAHYGTFPVLNQSADKFVKEMAGAKARVLVMKPGGSVDLQPRASSVATRGAA